MKAIDAAQLIVNRLSRIGKSIDRSDLTKMLYLLDLTVQKHTGKRLVELDTDELHISINRLDDGNYELRWDSYDTFEGLGTEAKVLPADFIHDFDSYYNKIKDEIEANNEVEKAKYKEFQKQEAEKEMDQKHKKLIAEINKKTEELNALKEKASSNGIEL